MKSDDLNLFYLSSLEIKGFKVVFWDFDGVIKDSVGVKSDAFESIFLPFGRDVAAKVREHHEKNGGVSRHKKIPIYLAWANQNISSDNIDRYTQKFSSLVVQSVLESKWVPGIYDYIISNFQEQDFILVTATPFEEIVCILHELEIDHCFKRVYGSPTHKSDAINQSLLDFGISPKDALMIGDSESDLFASRQTGVNFLLRKNQFNYFLHGPCESVIFDDLINEQNTKDSIN